MAVRKERSVPQGRRGGGSLVSGMYERCCGVGCWQGAVDHRGGFPSSHSPGGKSSAGPIYTSQCARRLCQTLRLPIPLPRNAAQFPVTYAQTDPRQRPTSPHARSLRQVFTVGVKGLRGISYSEKQNQACAILGQYYKMYFLSVFHRFQYTIQAR